MTSELSKGRQLGLSATTSIYHRYDQIILSLVMAEPGLVIVCKTKQDRRLLKKIAKKFVPHKKLKFVTLKHSEKVEGE